MIKPTPALALLAVLSFSAAEAAKPEAGVQSAPGGHPLCAALPATVPTMEVEVALPATPTGADAMPLRLRIPIPYVWEPGGPPANDGTDPSAPRRVGDGGEITIVADYRTLCPHLSEPAVGGSPGNGPPADDPPRRAFFTINDVARQAAGALRPAMTGTGELTPTGYGLLEWAPASGSLSERFYYFPGDATTPELFFDCSAGLPQFIPCKGFYDHPAGFSVLVRFRADEMRQFREMIGGAARLFDAFLNDRP